LPSADDEEKTQFLLCFARNDGHLLWRAELHSGGLHPINKFNSHASATAACDRQAVYVALVSNDQLWVSAVSLAGELLWQKSVGGYKHANGFGASPVLHGNLVIVASDNQLDPAIAALNRADGTTVWKTERRKSDNSATPVLGTVAGRKQLLLNGAHTVTSYDPDRGGEIWHVSHGTEVVACTMAFDERNVYASGNVPEKKMLAVRGDGQGDVTGSHVLWSTTREVTYVPSPICVGNHLFIVSDSGTAFCRDGQTGNVIWKKRLGGNFFSSPVLAAGNLYATNDAGVTYVFRAETEFELVAKNDIGETCMATPVFCGGRVYLRTTEHLYCIGSASGGAPSSAP
jgi:outer membrane protein assembly factor BamB